MFLPKLPYETDPDKSHDCWEVATGGMILRTAARPMHTSNTGLKLGREKSWPALDSGLRGCGFQFENTDSPNALFCSKHTELG